SQSESERDKEAEEAMLVASRRKPTPYRDARSLPHKEGIDRDTQYDFRMGPVDGPLPGLDPVQGPAGAQGAPAAGRADGGGLAVKARGGTRQPFRGATRFRRCARGRNVRGGGSR